MLSKDRSVLVAEDNAALLQLFCRILGKFGFDVMTATDGSEALAVYQDHQDEIGVVITDLEMPEMDGLELRENLHKITPDLPIVAVSAWADTLKFGDKLERHFAAVLTKPFTADVLVGQIKDLMKEEA